MNLLTKIRRFDLANLCLIILLCALNIAAQTNSANVPRAEYPRPDLVRAEWQTLNGAWQFEFDDQNAGLREGWYKNPSKTFAKTIQVPFAFQAKLSGVGETAYHDVVWYRRTMQIPASFRQNNRRVMLNFGAVDYEAIVWINGERAGEHRGGHVPFALDVTDLLSDNQNSVVVRVFDSSTDRTIPRGKQFWEPKSAAIWYTRTTGIWQPVWLETVAPTYIKRLKITPDIDNSQTRIEAVLNQPATVEKLRFTATLRGEAQAQTEIQARATGGANPLTVLKLDRQETWSPENPNLYDLRVELLGANNTVLDRVDSYFGQRKVHVQDGKIYLNNSPYFLKLILDQGYWQDGILTAPSDAALQYDIKMTKAMGLNGARKHQKVEDPRWLYWCDKMGLLVWGEMANAFDIYTDDYVRRFTDEWQAAIERDYNHPSIIAWTPINESWGVDRILTNQEQQAHAKTMYYLTRSLDSTRLVQDNDGWEHTDATDIFGIHDYARTGDELTAKYKILETDRSKIPRNGREAVANGFKYNNSPVVMTEFGGIAYRIGAVQAANEFGYGNIEPTKAAFLTRLDGQIKALRENRAIAGYCYTQLTDVEQEINGLMTYDRKLKATTEEFAKIFNR